MLSRQLSISTLCFISIFAGQVFLAQAKPNTAHATSPQHSAKKSSLDGVWLGTLDAGTNILHLRLDIKTDDAGQQNVTLYSLDQGNKPIPCANVQLNGKHLSFDVPVVKGHWAGTVSTNRTNLIGTWNQDPRCR